MTQIVAISLLIIEGVFRLYEQAVLIHEIDPEAEVFDRLRTTMTLATDAMVLVAIRFAREEADEDHPYGHGKMEDLAALFVGMILIVLSVQMILNGLDAYLDTRGLPDEGLPPPPPFFARAAPARAAASSVTRQGTRASRDRHARATACPLFTWVSPVGMPTRFVKGVTFSSRAYSLK